MCPQRHGDNTNLTLHANEFYLPEPNMTLTSVNHGDLPVMTHRGPLVLEYLHELYWVIMQSIYSHKRVLACRYDLTLPHGITLPDDAYTNGPINRFMKSLKAKLVYERYKRGSPHQCPLRYARAREISQDGMPHYHVLLLVNLNAYHTPGNQEQEEGRNLFWMVVEAWASALRIPDEEAIVRVHYDKKSSRSNTNSLNPNFDPEIGGVSFRLVPRDNYAQLPLLFKRASYLCKAEGKQYGERYRAFETSRK